MSGYSKSPKLLKGAIVQFSKAMILPVPNVIIFQYNPETITRSLTVYDADSSGGEASPHPAGKQAPDRSQPWDPAETFTMALELDATDALESPEFHPIAVVSGVADRLAALELLLYPSPDDGGGLSLSVSASLGAAGAAVGLGGGDAVAKDLTRPQVPVALFVWGTGRIVPVRLTTFSVEEQAFNPLLYPLRAKATIGMRVLSPEAIKGGKKKTDTMEDIAIFAYKFTQKQKQVLALANLANGVESILGLLPL